MNMKSELKKLMKKRIERFGGNNISCSKKYFYNEGQYSNNRDAVREILLKGNVPKDFDTLYREENVSRTIYKSYVIDDGWHLPQEVVEAIDLRVQATYGDAYRDVCREHDRHRGAWLTAEAVRSFFARSWV